MSLSCRKLLPLQTTTNVARSLMGWRPATTSRSYASRKDCAPYEGPRCSKERLEKLPDCAAKIQRMKANELMPKHDSMWENPECCTDPCPDYFPRFDELYYKSSDKLQRQYQQTWVACPELQLKPKVVCSFEQLKLPPLERRSHEAKPQTACPQGGAKVCMDSKNKKCPRLQMPMCRGGRSPPKCKRQRTPNDCQKECTPYPSYSECLRDATEMPHPSECKCLNHPMMCDVWAEMRRRMTSVK